MRKQISTFILTITLACILLLPTVQAMAPTAVKIQAILPHPDQRDPQIGGMPISVYFTLVDEAGRPLPDATIDETSITISIDGEKQAETTLGAPDTPLMVTMALDASSSMQPHLATMKTTVTKALNSAGQDVHFSLLFFDHEVQVVQPFTADRHLLQDAMRSLTIAAERYTCLYDAANAAIEALIPVIEHSPAVRRAVILFTDGENKSAPSSSCHYNTEDDVAEIIEFAHAQQVSIYTVSFGAGADVVLLEELAAKTGGLAFTGTESLDQKFDEVMTGLNSQRVARTTIFTEKEGSHTLTLNLRLRGEGQESEAIEAGTAVFETGVYPRLAASAELVEHRHDLAQGHYLVTIKAINADAIGCLVLKLRDLEINEPIAEKGICRPQEGESEHVLAVPTLVQGRDYQFELSGEGNLCPEQTSDSDQNPCLRKFTYLPGTITFDFQIEPQPEAKQLMVTLSDLDSRAFKWVKYQVEIAQGGASQGSFTDVLSNPEDPFILLFYPEPDSARRENVAQYKVTITLTAPGNFTGKEEKEIEIPLPARLDLFTRLAEFLRARPFLTIFGFLLLSGLPLAYFAKIQLERRIPGTRFLFGKGVYGAQPSPVAQRTQLPEPLWPEASVPTTSSVPAPKPLQPVETAVSQASLRIVACPNTTRRDEVIYMDAYPFRIGREDCHLTIGDERTSRTHATIQRVGRQYFIMDLASTNGTFLNGDAQSLSANMRWPLKDGDLIRLGTTIELKFSIQTHANQERKDVR